LKPFFPLQGFKGFIFGLIGLLVLVSLITTHETLAQDSSSDLNIREFTVTLEHLLSNAQHVERLFSELTSDLSVSGSPHEIQEAVAEMSSAADQLERIFSAFTENTRDESHRRQFLSALTQVEENAKLIQRLIRPNSISREQTSNLRDVHFALNNVISSSIRLKRMLGELPDFSNRAGDQHEVKLDEITAVFRHVVTNIHKAQTLSHSIDPGNVANSESISSIIEVLEQAKDESLQFSRMLRSYGASTDEHLRIIRKILNISTEISVELNRVIRKLSERDLTRELGSDEFRSDVLSAAFDHIMTKLREIRRALKALMGDIDRTDPDADLANTDSGITLQRFDLDGDCIITNQEILYALELWISREIDRELFMEVVDAWTTGAEICIVPDPLGKGTSAGDVSISTLRTPLGISFNVRGMDVLTTAVEIYDVSGRPVFSQTTANSRLNWNLKSKAGVRVANGVYFFITTFTRADGTEVRSGVQKIAVIQ